MDGRAVEGDGLENHRSERILNSKERLINMEFFTRINHDIKIMGGKPCIKGTRVTVGMILSQLSGGQSIDELLNDFPYLSREDILAALEYGAWAVNFQELAI
jgi:uncharacterized protein (DUF433 family)